MLKHYPDVLTIKDLCELLNCGKNYAYMLVSTNKISARRARENGKYYIPKDNVLKYLKES